MGLSLATLTKPSPSRTASTTPAVNDEQLNWLISRGTEMLRVIEGSLSITMSSVARESRYENLRMVSTHIRPDSRRFSL